MDKVKLPPPFDQEMESDYIYNNSSPLPKSKENAPSL
jgi:hypothetical protein